VRAVLDVNVLISAALSADGAPATAMGAWREGRFDLVLSPQLLAELRRALAYPKIRKRISEGEARAYLQDLSEAATIAQDPSESPSIHSLDPDDDYLLSLAAAETAYLVSGDQHLLSLSSTVPVLTPRRFLEVLQDPDTTGR